MDSEEGIVVEEYGRKKSQDVERFLAPAISDPMMRRAKAAVSTGTNNTIHLNGEEVF